MKNVDADAIVELGQAMRVRRTGMGLTLSDVAGGTGLSVPFLSQVETGGAAPSLVSLFAIARFLETTPERLLAGPVSADVVIVESGDGPQYPVTDDESGGAFRRQLTGLGEPFSAAEYRVEPDAELGDFFASEGRELIHVKTGRLAIDMEDVDGGLVTHELDAGDTIVYTTATRHRWRHLGDSTTSFLHISAPLH